MKPDLFDPATRAASSYPEGFLFVATFLDNAEQEALLSRVLELDYAHDLFRGKRLKRAYAQFGYAYVSTGRRLENAQAMPDFLLDLIAKAAPHYPTDAEFDQCIVTRYPEGAGIGWHTDAPRFGDYVMAVSLAAEARLQFRRNGSQEVECEVAAMPGSLYVLSGPARWDYQHQVVPVAAVRYSLTFRRAREAGTARSL